MVVSGCTGRGKGRGCIGRERSGTHTHAWSVECRGFESHSRQLIFEGGGGALGGGGRGHIHMHGV